MLVLFVHLQLLSNGESKKTKRLSVGFTTRDRWQLYSGSGRPDQRFQVKTRISVDYGLCGLAA